MGTAEDVEPDGRRQRRERGRTAVIDAVYELLVEGDPVTTDALVARSGVSLSSIFRYFASIPELQQQAIDRHFERSAPLFEVPGLGEGERADRIRRLVDARLALYEAIAPIGRLARSRAHHDELVAQHLQTTRLRVADQVAAHLAPELAGRPTAAAAEVVDLVSSLTSFEAWDLLTTAHGRTRAQLRRSWTTGVTALLA